MIQCPECHVTNTDAQWDKMTHDMCKGDFTPIAQGYGRMAFGYHCPSCFKIVSGKRLKEFNETK